MRVGGRLLTEAAVTLVALLAIFTVFFPDWIELVFGIDPDGGNGLVEWAFILVPALIAVASAAVACRRWNRARVTQ
jgi:hypothetical protein